MRAAGAGTGAGAEAFWKQFWAPGAARGTARVRAVSVISIPVIRIIPSTQLPVSTGEVTIQLTVAAQRTDLKISQIAIQIVVVDEQ